MSQTPAIQSAITLLIVISAVMLCTTALAADDATYRMKTVMVEMPDSVGLSTDIYLPNEDGQFPAVLCRLPYGTKNMAWLAEGLAESGYAVVLQNVRGTNGSEGDFFPFVYDRSDGTATVDWIVGQEWCDGKVGLWGASYSGFAAFEIASSGHPAISSIVNISGWSDLEPFLSHGGAFHLMAHLPWFVMFGAGEAAPPKEAWDQIFRATPISSLFRGADAVSEIAGSEYNYCAINAPTLHITGWYDYIYPNVLQTYGAISECSDGEVLQHLIIGPWAHNDVFNGVTKVGDEDFGPEARTDMDWVLQETTEWFDRTLMDKSNVIQAEKPVRVFVMHANEWREFESWPPGAVEFDELYVDASDQAGTLTRNKPEENGSLQTFTYDPNDPVPTVGGSNFHFFPENLGPKDQSAVETRPDILTYTSEPAKSDFLIVGPITAEVFVSSTASNMDITAKLVVVEEDGYVRNIEDGILRASSEIGPEGLDEGEIYRFEIDCGATAARINSGERLRLEISAGNFPKYDRNPQTGQDAFEATEFAPAEHTIYGTPEYPTHISVPILSVQ